MDVIQVCLAGLAVSLSSLFIYSFYLNQSHYWAKKSIPFLHPVAGLVQFVKSWLGMGLHEIDQEMYKKYGRVFGAFQESKPIIYVAEPELLRSILVKDFNVFSTRRNTVFGVPVLDNLVSSLKGDDRWKNIRNTMTPAFSSGKLKHMLPIMSECAKLSVKNFERFSNENNAVDLKRLFGNYTLDIIANVAFGTQLDSHNDPDNVFVTHARKFFASPFSLKKALVMSYLKIARKFGVKMPSNNSLGFFENVVNSIIDRRQVNKEVRPDFLQMMIESMQAGEVEKCEAAQGNNSEVKVQSVEQIKRKPLSELEVQAQCILFFLAGYDTTATTLTVATYHLATNPDIQRKVLKEVDEIWSKSETLDADSLREAKYLEAVIDETLRLAPPSTRLERIAGKDYVLGDTGVTIPQGMMVRVPTFSLHHDKDLFPEPEKFKPERFLNKEIQPYTYLPFGAGPRNCIGMRLAVLEVKLCLLYVMRRFEFSQCDQTVPLKLLNTVGIVQPNEIFLRVTKRKH